MHEWLSRKRRIIGRIINRKELPAFTYRLDKRAPATVRREGFQPWQVGGTISLTEHVNGAYGHGQRQGEPTKFDSQWVSTGAYGLLKKLDPTFAQQILDTNVYKIDTRLALTTGEFMDANDEFDRNNLQRPYATQREWIKLGGIPNTAVVAFMTGKDFFASYDLTTGAPAEDALAGWQTF